MPQKISKPQGVSLERCLDLARLACREAVRAGADAAEAAVGLGCSLDAELEEGRLKGTSRHEGRSVSVRAFSRGGRGSFVSHEISERSARDAARRAAALARAASADPDWRGLSGRHRLPAVAGLWDPLLARPRAGLVLQMAEGLLAAAQAEAPGCKVSGAVSVTASHSAFANSEGLQNAGRSTSVTGGCLAVVKRGSRHGSFYDFDVGRRLADVNMAPVGKAAARGALEYLGGGSMAGGRMPVVLGPLAAAALIESVVSAASAESVQRRRSFLVGRLGRRIASPLLTVTDVGTWPGGVYSAPADSEGVPHRPLVVIERGVLRSLLHNTYTAGKARARSTGHCAGGGCAPTNLRPEPGELTAAEIVAGVKRGLYVNSASIYPNPSSGDISAMVDFGMAIENGRLAGPVANVSIAGHVLELLAGIDAVSSDCREEPGCLMPTLRIRRVHVSGAG